MRAIFRDLDVQMGMSLSVGLFEFICLSARRVRSEFLAGSKTAKRRATAGATGTPAPLRLPPNSMLPSLDPQTGMWHTT